MRLAIVVVIMIFVMTFLSGCIVAPDIDSTTHAITCCTAYAEPYPGVTTSLTFKKEVHDYSLNGDMKWKF